MRRRKQLNALIYIPLILMAAIYVVPIVMMLLGSVKGPDEVLAFNLSPPSKVHLENYTHVIEEGHILRGYRNSFLMSSMSTIFSIIFGAFAGIILGRRTEKISSKLYFYFIFGQAVTFQTASTFYLLKHLHLYGTFIGVICIYIAARLPFTIMTFCSFVKNIPREIDEAAIIDGCSPLRLIFRVLLPIMKPIFITNLILTAIGVWNNFMIPMFYLGKAAKWPVPLVIYNFFGQYVYDWHYVFAALTLTVAPMLILFLCLQKYIVGGMTSGSVKG